MTRNQTIVLIAGGALLLLIAVLSLGLGKNGGNQDRLNDNQVASAGNAAGPQVKPEDPGRRCANQATYDKIKRELFTQAAQTRGKDGDIYARLADFAVLRMDSPAMQNNDAGLDLVRCVGRATLSLPPGVQVVGGRNSLSADLQYSVQAAADGNGDVVMVQGADAITVPLATLSRSANGPASPQAPAGEQPPPLSPASPQAAPAPAPSPAGQASVVSPPPRVGHKMVTNPSFPCNSARTSGEEAVCADEGLAALDRQMAFAYGQARSEADMTQRDLLRQTARRFYGFRDSCTTNACVAGAYRDRMREIRDIMSGNWAPPR